MERHRLLLSQFFTSCGRPRRLQRTGKPIIFIKTTFNFHFSCYRQPYCLCVHNVERHYQVQRWRVLCNKSVTGKVSRLGRDAARHCPTGKRDEAQRFTREIYRDTGRKPDGTIQNPDEKSSLATDCVELRNSHFRRPRPLQAHGRQFRIEHRKRNHPVCFGHGERRELFLTIFKPIITSKGVVGNDVFPISPWKIFGISIFLRTPRKPRIFQ